MKNENANVEVIVEHLNEALGHRGMHLVNGKKAKRFWTLLPLSMRDAYRGVMSDRELVLVGEKTNS